MQMVLSSPLNGLAASNGEYLSTVICTRSNTERIVVKKKDNNAAVCIQVLKNRFLPYLYIRFRYGQNAHFY